MRVDITTLKPGAMIQDDDLGVWVVTDIKDKACNIFTGKMVCIKSLKQPIKFTAPQEIVW